MATVDKAKTIHLPAFGGSTQKKWAKVPPPSKP
jgi:hypothetical protein